MIVSSASVRLSPTSRLGAILWIPFWVWAMTATGLHAQNADLSIQVSDGLTEATPGTFLTYTVRVLNEGPDDAPGVVVSNVFPAALSCLWTCIGSGGAGCTPGQVSGDIADSFDMPSGTLATYSAQCQIATDAAGTLQNSAQVLTPAGITDPNPNNNADSDLDTLLVPRFDVQLNKTDDLDDVLPGDTLTYLLNIQHAGPSDAVGIRVQDALPDGLTDITWTCQASQGSTCTLAGSGDLDDLATLRAGGDLQYAIEATVQTDTTGTLFNLAALTPPVGAIDTNRSNNGDSDSTLINVQLDLRLEVDADAQSVVPGESQGYVVEVHNDGPADAVGAQLVVSWPHDLEDLSWTCTPSGGAVCPSPGGSGNILSPLHLPVGTSLAYALESRVDPAAVDPLQLHGSVQPPLGASDPQGSNNQASLMTPLTPRVSVAAVLSTEAESAIPGRDTTYSLRITQDGPSDAPGIGISSPTVTGTECLWTCEATGGASCPAGPVAEEVDLILDLPAGSGLGISFDCAIDPAASGDLMPSAALTIPPTIEDSNLSDNVSHLTLPLRPEADLAVTKTDGLSQVSAGTSTTYTLEVRNTLGPSDARQVTVQDLFVETLDCTWTCVGQAGGLCTPGQVAGDIDDVVQLPVGSRVTYTAQCSIAPEATNSLVNGVSVTLPPGLTDPNGSNNSALDTTDIEPAVDLAIHLDDGVESAVPGTSLTYNLTVDNLGNTEADGAEVRSLFPDALSCTWGCVAGAGATCTAGQVEGDLVDIIRLPPGGQVIYTALCDIDASADGLLSHQATVEPPPGLLDLQPGNNQASDLDTRLEPHADVAILKTDGLVAVQPGGELIYTITVSNAGGPSEIRNATVDDLLPEGLGCTWSCAVSGGATCTPVPPPGDLHDVVDLPVGSLAVYTATCTLAEDADTSPVNTATVTVSTDTVDPDLDNNSATDDDTLLVPTVDLRLTLTPDDEAVAGSSLGYILEASHPVQLILRAETPEGIQLFALPLPSSPSSTPLHWSHLGPSETSPFRHAVFAPSVEHPLDGTRWALDAAEGELRWFLNRSAPGAPSRRLGLRLPLGFESAAPQGLAIVPQLATSARVRNQTSSNLQCTWTCAASGGGQCTAGPVTGPLDDAVELPLGARLAYMLDCRLPSSAEGTVHHSATLTPAPGTIDRQPDDNLASVELPVAHHADLHLSKTDGVLEASPGATITYTLVASNPVGPSDVNGAQVVDLFAPELDCLWSCQAEAGGTCTPGQTSGNVQDSVDLPVGAVSTYTALCTIAPDAEGSLSNTADLLVPGGVLELNGGDNRASDLDTVLVPTADLAVQLQAEPSAVPGTTTAWTLTVDNHGPSAVQGAQVESPFPQGLSCLWGCEGSGGAVCTPGQVAGDLVDLVSLPVGSRATYQMQCDVGSDQTGQLELQANAQLPVLGNDPMIGNNLDQAVLLLSPTADLVLTKTNGVDSVHPGGAVTYRLVTRNGVGPSDMSDVRVLDPLDGSLTHCAWTCQGSGGGQCGDVLSDGPLEDAAHLPVGGSVTYTGQCSVDSTATGQLVNVASLSLPDGSVDPNPLNNTDSDVDVLVPRVHLRVDLSASREEVVAGEALTYHLDVTNQGPSPALGATLLATVADGLACIWTCLDSSSGVCSPQTTGNLLDQVDLPASASLHYEAACQVDPSAEGSLLTFARIDPPPGSDEVDEADNLDSVEIDVQRRADLSITKDDRQDSAQPGETVVYAIRVHNQGPSQVDAAVVEDIFSESLTCRWSCAPDLGIQCREGETEGDLQDTLTLPPGLGALYSASCTIAHDAGGDLINQATITIEGAEGTEDPNLENNLATDLNVLGSDADLSLTLTAEPDPVASGNLLLYRAHLDNGGPLTDGAVHVTVLLPAASQWLTAFVGDPGLLFRDGFESGDTSAWQGDSSLGATNPCTSQGNTLDCRLGALGPGDGLDLVIAVEVLAEDGSTLVATATLSGAGTDPDSSNNTDSNITQVGSENGHTMTETPR